MYEGGPSGPGFAAAPLLGLRVRIPPVGMDGFLLQVLCVVRQRSLLRADHSYREVLQCVCVCVCVCDQVQQ